MDDPAHGDAMVTIAIVVSRVEALVLVSLLEAAGVLAVAGGVHHASVAVNSLALGGHRIWVPASQWTEASAILLETGAGSDWVFSSGLRRAVLRFLGAWFCLYGGMAGLTALAGVYPLSILASVPPAMIVPVNPQGRGDFYLAAETA